MSESFFALSDIHVCATGILFSAGPEDGPSKKFFLARQAIEHLAGGPVDGVACESVFYRHASRIGDVAHRLLSVASNRFPTVLGAGDFR